MQEGMDCETFKEIIQEIRKPNARSKEEQGFIYGIPYEGGFFAKMYSNVITPFHLEISDQFVMKIGLGKSCDSRFEAWQKGCADKASEPFSDLVPRSHIAETLIHKAF